MTCFVSASTGEAAQQARIAEALDDHVQDVGQRPIGRQLGVAGSTVGRWGVDLDAWPARALLNRARHIPTVKVAVLAYLNDQTQERGDAAAAIGNAHRTMESAAKLIGEIAADVSDGRINRQELARIRERAASLREALDRLELDAEAAAGVRL